MHTHPWNDVVPNGGCVDIWYLDDGTAFMHPSLACAYLEAYDAQTARRGGRRNFKKTKVILYASDDHMAQHRTEWKMDKLD
eukprot:11673489-Karenia_brevis.AAC.1